VKYINELDNIKDYFKRRMIKFNFKKKGNLKEKFHFWKFAKRNMIKC